MSETTADRTMNDADMDALLNKLTVQDLVRLTQAAEAKRREKIDAAKGNLVAEFRAKAEQLGLSLDALMPSPAPSGRPRKSGERAKVAAKFRGPNGEEWTGRGRLPTWLKTLEAEGQSRDQFAV